MSRTTTIKWFRQHYKRWTEAAYPLRALQMLTSLCPRKVLFSNSAATNCQERRVLRSIELLNSSPVLLTTFDNKLRRDVRLINLTGRLLFNFTWSLCVNWINFFVPTDAWVDALVKSLFTTKYRRSLVEAPDLLQGRRSSQIGIDADSTPLQLLLEVQLGVNRPPETWIEYAVQLGIRLIKLAYSSEIHASDEYRCVRAFPFPVRQNAMGISRRQHFRYASSASARMLLSISPRLVHHFTIYRPHATSNSSGVQSVTKCDISRQSNNDSSFFMCHCCLHICFVKTLKTRQRKQLTATWSIIVHLHFRFRSDVLKKWICGCPIFGQSLPA